MPSIAVATGLTSFVHERKGAGAKLYLKARNRSDIATDGHGREIQCGQRWRCREAVLLSMDASGRLVSIRGLVSHCRPPGMTARMGDCSVLTPRRFQAPRHRRGSAPAPRTGTRTATPPLSPPQGRSGDRASGDRIQCTCSPNPTSRRSRPDRGRVRARHRRRLA